MKILAIETSCDETAVAILEAEGSTAGARYRILGDALFSQAHLHAAYGGVYPNLAKREHQKNLVPLTIRALTEANLLKQNAPGTPMQLHNFSGVREEVFRNDISDFVNHYEKPEVNMIAVTRGPGLEPALWTGITFAEALGSVWGIPVLGIDHMEGHIISALLNPADGGHSAGGNRELHAADFELSALQFPILALLISGGHTEFILMKEWFKYELVGRTKDDAVGEAFDKVARLLDLPYPGGPEVAAHARRSRERGAAHDIVFPRPLANDDTCNFSFSGLKTAVLYKLQKMPELTPSDKEHIAHAFEDAAAEIITIKTRRALEKTNARVLAVGGGVSANTKIRSDLAALIANEFPHTELRLPEKTLTGDNAIMIGIAAHMRATRGTTPTHPLIAEGSKKLADQA